MTAPAGGAAPPGFTPPADFAPGDVPGSDGGPRLRYWRHGRGRPLLILHGVTDGGLDWAGFARRVGEVCSCVLLDQRGHGYSGKPDAGYRYADLAADAWRVIEALGLERPAVLGHSMGGGVALALAAAHPQEIDRLLLVDPAIRLDAPETGDVGGENRRMDPAAQEAQLRRLTHPTLVVRGEPERGAIVGDAMARRIRELVPDDLARVTTITGTGHVPHREALALFVAVVRPFLTGETAPPSEGGSPVCFAHLRPGAD